MYHSHFESSYLKPTLFAATAYRHRSSRKVQQAIIICVVCCVIALIWLGRDMVLIQLYYIINHFLKQNLYRFRRYNIEEGKFFLW